MPRRRLTEWIGEKLVSCVILPYISSQAAFEWNDSNSEYFHLYHSTRQPFALLSDPVMILAQSEIPWVIRMALYGDDLFVTFVQSVLTALYILAIFNSSLNSGVVPACFKHAVVQPVIKETNLDSSVLASFRPLSKLPFLSIILENNVFFQLQFLYSHHVLERFQRLNCLNLPLHIRQAPTLNLFKSYLKTLLTVF